MPQETHITIDGASIALGMQSAEPLVRAVIISLFTWRRARPDDPLPGSDRFGWWGDSFPPVPGDRIGSRLWLLSREKITASTIERAREYAYEALEWMIEDGIASRVVVDVERHNLTTLALLVQIYRTPDAALNLRFSNVWEFLNVVQ